MQISQQIRHKHRQQHNTRLLRISVFAAAAAFWVTLALWSLN